MVKYNFKELPVVPTATEFVDIILSKTQRKTPTVIHARKQMNIIRQFYMRKVKFTQAEFNAKISQILDNFPTLANIHPFYADLMNVLYDKDHYKLALGQLNTCRAIIDKLGKDYVKLIKYGDSLYRCKSLKRAALGRMATMMKKQKAALGYLEQVRQHLSRLPTIDPDERTLLLTGFPNVGKSSFINKITRADVEVQSYAFTTKALYVGHTDYRYVRWQVIDSPGVLDRPLEDRNTIEMQAITALAHLNAVIVFMIDLSPGCKYSIADQVNLFLSLKPLWVKKPVVVCCNKTDLRKVSELPLEEQNLLSNLKNEGMVTVMEMSNLMEEGLMEVRNKACDILLDHRIHVKTQQNKMKNIANRIFLAKPTKRDNIERPAFIPQKVLDKREEERKESAMEVDEVSKQTEKDLEVAMGGFGVYNQDMRKFWDLKNEDWKYDAIPETMNGKNVADFVDSDIMEKLAVLEAEEETILRNIEEANAGRDETMELSDNDELLYDEIQYQKRKVGQHHKEVFRANHAVRPRTIQTRSLNGMENHLTDLGYDMDTFLHRANKVKEDAIAKQKETDEGDGRGRSAVRRAISQKRERSEARRKKTFTKSALKRIVKPGKGLGSIRETIASKKMLHRSLKKIGKKGKQGTSDRFIACLMPKHLFSGKRGIGKTDRR